MILKVERVDLRKMIKEKVEDIFNDKQIADMMYSKIVTIEDDERFEIVSLNDKK